MSAEGPKLFTHKPKKSKLKASTPITMAPASWTGAAPPPPPSPPTPQPQKESFVRRYRFLWPLLLVVNFTIGAYVLMRTRTKNASEEIPEEGSTGPTPTSAVTTAAEGPTGSTPTSTVTTTVAAATINEKPITPPTIEPVVRAPIPEDQQREVLKWILEEKRKVKPRDAEEKRQTDEEKAILKQFIRAKSIPSL